MDTRIILEKEYDKAKELWYVSFGDSPEFINNYFSTKVKRDNIFGVFDLRLNGLFVIGTNKDLLLCKSSIHLEYANAI